MATEADLRDAYTLIRDVARVSRLFQQDSVHCGGVTFQQFTILDHVREAGGELGLGALHDLLAVEKSTTTRLVEPLVDRGFLAKAPSAEDARAVRLVLTHAGKDAHREYWACMEGSLRQVIAGLSARQYEEMKQALRLFVRGVGQRYGGACCR